MDFRGYFVFRGEIRVELPKFDAIRGGQGGRCETRMPILVCLASPD